MAAATELSIILKAEDKASAAIGGVQTKMGKLSAGIQQHSRAIGIGMAAAGTAIVGAGLLSVKTFSAMGDEIAKMAKRTGFSTEALSELRHAAELSGTSLTGLEKASRTLSGAIVDAQDGLATYTRAFERIGVDYNALAAMKPEQQFITVMEALAGVEDETVRAATAADLLGARVGTALLPMLAEGSEGLAEMRAEAHDLGIVFDKEAAAKAELMKDTMLRLEKAMTSISLVLAEQLMPAILPLIIKITEITKRVRGWAEEHPLLSNVISKLAMGLGLLLIPLGTLLIFLPSITAALPILGTVFTALLGPVGLVIAAIAAWIAIGVLLWKKWNEISVGVKIAIALLLGPIGQMIIAGIALVKNWDKVARFFKETLPDAFKTGINAIIWFFNKMISFISGKKLFSIDIPGWIPGIGGKKFELALPTLPTIPTLRYGGIVPGPIGKPVPVIAHGGERYLGAGKGTTATTINVYVDYLTGDRESAERLGDTIVKVLRGRQRTALGEASY